jgi:DNA-binding IclR family transcriptional regulator
VTEVTRRLGLPKASASRLLRSMREAGMLETIGDTRRHRPGRMMLDLAAAFRHSSGIIGRAGEVVAETVRRFGHTGYVSVRDGREVTAVADFEGSNSLRVVSNIGRRLPAHLSATGRTLLARLAETEVAAIYHGHPDLDRLMARLERVRRQGFAVSTEETTPGVEAVALAVTDPATDESVSLCIVYPHRLVSREECAAMIAALGHGAGRIAEAVQDARFVAPDFREGIAP